MAKKVKSKPQTLPEAAASASAALLDAVAKHAQSQPKPVGFFPLPRVISIVGVHTTLTLFSAIYLPRSFYSSLSDLGFDLLDEVQKSSQDRPQIAFLNPITSSPLLTLLSMSVGALILQTYWASWVRTWVEDWNYSLIADAGKAEGKTRDAKRIMSNVYQACKATVIASVFLHVIIVLFGAPLLAYGLKTYALALLLSILTVYTPAYVLGAPKFALPGTGTSKSGELVRKLNWVRLFAEWNAQSPPETLLIFPFISTFAATLFSCIPLALDWDRPWQAWPLPPAYGAILGLVGGELLGLTVLVVKDLVALSKSTP